MNSLLNDILRTAFPFLNRKLKEKSRVFKKFFGTAGCCQLKRKKKKEIGSMPFNNQ